MPDDSDTTTSTLTRWPYTNDVLAAAIVLSFVAVVVALAYAIATGRYSTDINLDILLWAYVTLVLLAATWAFGDDAFNALKNLRGGGGA